MPFFFSQDLPSLDSLLYYFDGRCVCPFLQKIQTNSDSEESRLRDFFIENKEVLDREPKYTKPTDHIDNHIHTGKKYIFYPANYIPQFRPAIWQLHTLV